MAIKKTGKKTTSTSKKTTEEKKSISATEKSRKTTEKKPTAAQLKKQEQQRVAELFDQFSDVVASCRKYIEKTTLDQNQVLFAYLDALPQDLKPAMEDIALQLKVTVRTLQRRRHDIEFRKVRTQFIVEILKDKTPEVLNNLYEGATSKNWTTGAVNTGAIKLWLQYVEKFKEGQALDLTSGGEKVQFAFGFDKFDIEEVKKQREAKQQEAMQKNNKISTK